MYFGASMAKIKTATFDTGPVMHLYEIQQISVLNIITHKIVPNEVIRELSRQKIPTINVKEIPLNAKSKDFAKLLIKRYQLDLGEAQAIALTIQEKTDCFFTDDLDARTVAHSFSIQVHGTLGLITRALREHVITKDEAKRAIQDLHKQSTLFLTSDLVTWALQEIESYKR